MHCNNKMLSGSNAQKVDLKPIPTNTFARQAIQALATTEGNYCPQCDAPFFATHVNVPHGCLSRIACGLGRVPKIVPDRSGPRSEKQSILLLIGG